jgi:hypothetical protein
LAALGLLSDLLRAVQNEIQRHNLSTFMSKEHKIVQTGCSFCRKHFGTVEHPFIMTEPLNAVEIPDRRPRGTV